MECKGIKGKIKKKLKEKIRLAASAKIIETMKDGMGDPSDEESSGGSDPEAGTTKKGWY